MRYYVVIGERTLEVEVEDGRVVVEGRAMTAELADLPGTGIRHLLLDGRSYTFVVGTGGRPGRWDLHVEDARLDVEVIDERTRAIRALTGRTAAVPAPGAVVAPMPGLVVRLEVEVGDRVEAGQGIVVMEAMKMENELKAPAAGTVSAVRCGAGEAVEKGAVLVEFAAE
jgi:pyruvate carboxylase subunit B